MHELIVRFESTSWFPTLNTELDGELIHEFLVVHDDRLVESAQNDAILVVQVIVQAVIQQDQLTTPGFVFSYKHWKQMQNNYRHISLLQGLTWSFIPSRKYIGYQSCWTSRQWLGVNQIDSCNFELRLPGQLCITSNSTAFRDGLNICVK